MKRPSPAEPVGELRRIPIVDCGEPLVDFLKVCPLLILDRPRFRYRRETLIRAGVAEKLRRASERLPQGLRLAVIEGWRAPFIQRRMYQAIKREMRRRYPDLQSLALTRIVNRYSAPMSSKVPPPHTTGGAVDLMLARDDGSLLDHCSPFEWRDPDGFSFDARGLSAEALTTRRILSECLLEEGLTNYPSEYWHWSYGDQGWAYRGAQPFAIYGAIEPEDWQPAPEDLSDQPLEWAESQARLGDNAS